MFIPDELIWFCVGFIFSPLFIYGIFEFIIRIKAKKIIKSTKMTKKEAKQKLREMFDDNTDNERGSTKD